MLVIFGVIIFGVLFWAVIAATAGKKSESTKVTINYRYSSRTPLTKSEQAVYWKLIEALPGYVVLAQVELSRCISAKGLAFNAINGESLDFVVCNRALEVIAGIEIDDGLHSALASKKRDVAKNDAMRIAGIRLIRWSSTPLPSTEQIKQEFPFAAENTKQKTSTERAQEKKIKLLERQLFNIMQKSERTPGDSTNI